VEKQKEASVSFSETVPKPCLNATSTLVFAQFSYLILKMFMILEFLLMPLGFLIGQRYKHIYNTTQQKSIYFQIIFCMYHNSLTVNKKAAATTFGNDGHTAL